HGGSEGWQAQDREAAANLLTNDALDPQAKIPEYKAGVVRVTKARWEELPTDDYQPRGRY
ncbi:MAG TPA: hypothetical protein PLV53_13610, partial [Anaerolineaceae bacterium]|nr:hypothetical protein [Anaerolineaceae bacterium]